MMKRVALIMCLAISLFASRSFAATLSQYRESVVTARAYLNELEEHAYPTAEKFDSGVALPLVKAIKAELPENTSVDQASGRIEASNSWLHVRLDAFLAETDAAKRLTILTESSERLDALTKQIDELMGAAASERSKDEDKQKLAEILRREEYQKPKAAEESLIQRWLSALLDWIASLFPHSPRSQPNLSGMPNLAFILQVILYAAITCLIIFGIYKLAPAIFPKLKRKRTAKRKDPVVLGERIADNVSADDLFAEAEALASKGDLRGAIRKSYVALICDLSDRRLIRLARHKTNRDYLREIRSREELLRQMSGVTTEFERSWYGSRAAAADDWTTFRESCERTLTLARSET
jgi:hypothetical protein